METKICGRCKQEKPIDEFGFKNKSKGTRTSYCKECNREYQKQHYFNNRETYLAKMPSKEVKRAAKYGLTVEEVEELLSKNNGMCCICNIEKAVHIDHCHKTGTVRGGLCHLCNLGLGAFKDNVEFLENAITYLSILER